ncbi:MAG: DUF6265 family protein [Psychroserpens sp.]|uniref:DUF6265 family protein n=1 Tax=Psychroserpens sp. TaxID=2020870 RepID=UPI003C750C1D
MKFICSLIFLCSSLIYAQNDTRPSDTLAPKLENIKWISGLWKGEAFGGLTEENWSEPSGGSMMATFKLINDNEVTFYEIEIIREVENSLILQLKHFDKDLKGWETKNETVDFPLKYITKDKAVFEGMSFEKVGDTKMHVFVDIKNDNGDIEKIKFEYTRSETPNKPITHLTQVKTAKIAPIIDGKANDAIWTKAQWLPLDQIWLGNPITKNDFQGRYKLAWTKDALYLLAEIQDDVLLDQEPDPLVNWWDDDCLEIFIDEDNSGGPHQFTHNAFAYHVALDGNVVDMSTKKTGKLYNSHIESKRKTMENTSVWEVKISLFDDSYNDESDNHPVQLYIKKNIGFALAYCDNDTSKTRENFIGSIPVEGDDKNRGWIDASIFGTLVLVK